MVSTHNLGFPRIGANRELKFALEAYWRGEQTATALEALAADLRRRHWQVQAGCDWQPVGDFSLYDQVLDTSFMLGHLPQRFAHLDANHLDTYFAVARGVDGTVDQGCGCTASGEPATGHAAEMTKWFDTNYHYLVPEVTADTAFSLHSERLLAQVAEAQSLGVKAKPVIIGPVTYLWLSRSKDGSDRLQLLDRLLPVYSTLLTQLADAGCDWVQIDEPVLVTELDSDWSHALSRAYHSLQSRQLNILVAAYFGTLGANLQLACQLPVAGLHVDAVRGRGEVSQLVDWLPAHKVLSLGVIDGRNIWRADLNELLDWLEPVAANLAERLWLAPSCSLLHVPVDKTADQRLQQQADIYAWLSFAQQKLDELDCLQRALNVGRQAVAGLLAENQQAMIARWQSARVHRPAVQTAVASVAADWTDRQRPYAERARLQNAWLQLPPLPTTTIGSFPQTAAIRRLRRQFKQGVLTGAEYKQAMQEAITDAIRQQEAIGLDVLVHGEAERNDMVEYFGEQLDGFVFSGAGWVQSYGSRCVKPPIIYGDVQRPGPMTVAWIEFAQAQTDKPLKGMLTGPVTLLNWSFVRDDQPRSDTCRQLALAIRAEVLDLERAGIGIIQIDEAALREGLPLRRSDWQAYLTWAVDAFRLAANGVQDRTQIHTHMCYSDFNDIIAAIARMDADVITIETSRSDMALLDTFARFAYPNAIGPGVYDIHSPAIPGEQQMVTLLNRAMRYIPPERLWVNPDCGLKTRQWAEVLPALTQMVDAAHRLRAGLAADSGNTGH